MYLLVKNPGIKRLEKQTLKITVGGSKIPKQRGDQRPKPINVAQPRFFYDGPVTYRWVESKAQTVPVVQRCRYIVRAERNMRRAEIKAAQILENFEPTFGI